MVGFLWRSRIVTRRIRFQKERKEILLQKMKPKNETKCPMCKESIKFVLPPGSMSKSPKRLPLCSFEREVVQGFPFP